MRLYLDSNIFIYVLADQPPYNKTAGSILKSVETGQHYANTSSIAYGEVIGTLQVPNHINAAHAFIDDLINLQTIPVIDTIAQTAGKLRLSNKMLLRLPDAIHLATALETKAELFITNDLTLANIARTILPTKTLSEWK